MSLLPILHCSVPLPAQLLATREKLLHPEPRRRMTLAQLLEALNGIDEAQLAAPPTLSSTSTTAHSPGSRHEVPLADLCHSAAPDALHRLDEETGDEPGDLVELDDDTCDEPPDELDEETGELDSEAEQPLADDTRAERACKEE